jgi:deferrochelatase/peroxidase EfeB
MSPTLTLTVGLGPGVCPRPVRPVALRDLPPFPGDALDPRWCGGDLAVQVCAQDPRDASERAAAARVRRRRGDRAPLAAVRPRSSAGPGTARPGTPRDPLGFRDGTHNLRRSRDLDRYVWIDRGDRTAMAGGTYLVVRRIDIDADAWNALALTEQEQQIGRHRDSGAPLGGRRSSIRRRWTPFPAGSHVRLASPRTGPSPPMLRRSYNTEGGLLFLAFMRDPARQFVPVQRRLAERDPLAAFTRHTGSAVFAIPPAARPGAFVGAGLVAAS